MVQNTLAVPSTRAEVEHEFSLSGHIATAIHCRLSPETISSIIIYKNYLVHQRRELKYYYRGRLGIGKEVDIGSDDEVLKE
jgi:hypothetical protein